MIGQHPASAGLAFKRALWSAASGLLPATGDTAVFWGYPGNTYPREAVAVTDTRSTQEVATLGRPRGRDEFLEQDVMIVVTANGSSDEAQQRVEARAYEILALIETHCRETDPNLGDSVLWCALGSFEVEGFTPTEQLSAGYSCQISATFTARARVRTL